MVRIYSPPLTFSQAKACPRPDRGKGLSYIGSIINEYLKNEYSLIPIDKEKKPYIYWKSYQYKKANIEDIFDWCNKFSDINIGIVTGDISKLAVIDVDDPNLLPELEELVPELKETTRVKTRRGYHYYFSLNGDYVKSTNNLFGKRLELKSNGNYVVAPPSTIKAHRYVYEIPLSEILPIPKILIKKNNPASLTKDKKHNTFKIPKYHGQKVDCIRQILSRDLEEGERNNSLFILYNLLLRNKNTKEYAKYLVIEKNVSLSKPLNKIELKKVCRKASYNYGCVGIRDGLAYIKCEACKYRFKDGELKDSNILIKNIRMLPKLSNTQRGIACLLGTIFEGKIPSVYRITKEANMDWRIVNNAMKSLKKKGFFD